MYITETHIASSETQLEATPIILDVHGTLDGSSLQTLLQSAKASIEKGSRRMIINLAEVDSISNAGLLGLYMVGELLEGRSVDDLEGWTVIDQLRETLEHGGTFPNLSLAAPNQNVAHTLHTSSFFDRLVRTLPTVDDAVAAFLPGDLE
jgi:hypothetical protein